MALKERIADEMKAALLGGNRFEGETLRNLRGAILDEEVASGKREAGLTDEEIERVVAREVKKRTESAKIYRENDRTDLAENEEKEISVLSKLLPEQMSEDELRTLVARKVAELGVDSPAAMGQVIGAVKSDVGNSADGAAIARIVKETLAK